MYFFCCLFVVRYIKLNFCFYNNSKNNNNNNRNNNIIQEHANIMYNAGKACMYGLYKKRKRSNNNSDV